VGDHNRGRIIVERLAARSDRGDRSLPDLDDIRGEFVGVV
jgi:hypothetical protein